MDLIIHQKKCKKPKACPNCAKEEDHNDCKNEMQCISCTYAKNNMLPGHESLNNLNHHTLDKNCPTYLKLLRIEKEKFSSNQQ